MSGFRMSIEVPRAEWDAMTSERKAALQKMVDETNGPYLEDCMQGDWGGYVEEMQLGAGRALDFSKNLYGE